MATTSGSPTTRDPRQRDEIELFPSFGKRDANNSECLLLIRGHVTRPRHDGLGLRLLERFYLRAFRISPEEAAGPLYRDRIQGFLERARRGTLVRIHLPHGNCDLPRASRPNGHFQATIRIPTPGPWIDTLGDDEDRWIRIQASAARAPLPADSRCPVLSHAGPSVISDIDDTIKATHVAERRLLIANTFLLPFEPIGGMAGVYRAWEGAGAAFHYVSSSPWQLFRPLQDFLAASGFPDGSFHLRTIQLRDPSILQLVFGKKRSKRRAMQSILKWFPQRQFVLVGDAGEKDPELYGALARRHAPQIARIFIRRLPNADLSHSRLEKAFRQVDPRCWSLYSAPEELLSAIPQANV
ncbi:MAG TPA: App1 family protein, partial [Pirellulaceae bacterium]